MDNSNKKVGIDIQDSSKVRMRNVTVSGFDTGLKTKNVHHMDMKNVSTIYTKDNKLKWFKDRNFLAAIVIGGVTIFLTLVL